MFLWGASQLLESPFFPPPGFCNSVLQQDKSHGDNQAMGGSSGGDGGSGTDKPNENWNTQALA